MKSLLLLLAAILILSACSSTPKPVREERELLAKYPKCYHISRKIFDECIRRNEAGDAVTALEIENNGLPK